jgi:6-phosphogluconate dehydrogenase
MGQQETAMKYGMIGLGRMGKNMARRLIRGEHEVVVSNRSPEPVAELEAEGAVGASSLGELLEKLESPRAIWISLPSGEVTENTLTQLAPLLARGDVVVDSGNSYYKDSIRRASQFQALGIDLLDQGTSGGVWGLELGYCLMIGGARESYERLEPAFKTLAPPDGYLHTGPSGSGHFVKMVHNGIEYGMLEAYAEGFELLNASDFNALDLHAVSHLWNQGSVVRSWLLELAERAFQKDPALASIRGYVEDSGEGRWTVLEAIEKNIPAPVLALSLMTRFRSRQEESFSAKVIAALRNEFGGHAVRASREPFPSTTP